MKWILIYLLCINIVVFVLYGIDKRRSIKKQWRISELTLIFMAAIGGSFGAFLGINIFHHKTKHWKFRIIIPLLLVTHIFILVQLVIRYPKLLNL